MSKSEAQIWVEVQKLYPEANFLQSPAWAETNRLIGHKVIIEHNVQLNSVKDNEQNVQLATVDAMSKGAWWCLMIVKNAKRGRYLEIPGGPLVDWQDEAAVREVLARARTVAKQEKCVFIRLRPQLRRGIEPEPKLAAHGVRPAPMHLHAEHTVMLDLSQSPDSLLAAMRRQTRYEVRRAAKLGIQVTWANDEAIFREFQQAQADTAARQHFVPPDLRTLLAEREAFGDNARLYRAQTAEGEPIAYGLILIDGDEAAYFEAASTDLNRKLPGAYALQWQVIQDLHGLGVQRYNLWGIAPAGQKNHRYAGVTTFKTGFGGEIVEFVPAGDIIIRRLRYLFNLLVETLRKKRRHLG